MNVKKQHTCSTSALHFLPIQGGLLNRKCTCGNHFLTEKKCIKCENNRFGFRKKDNTQNKISKVSPKAHDTFYSKSPKVNYHNFYYDSTRTTKPPNYIARAPQTINFGEDPIHQPLINNYRRVTAQPLDESDEPEQRIEPADAQLKYSGILGRIRSEARWLTPVINEKNAAESYFKSTPLIDPPGGLTTQFVNAQEIHDNLGVEAAIPRPPVQTRNESSRTFCWFNHGISVTGRTIMDIFSPGPWNFPITGAQASSRFANPACRTRSSSTVVHVDGNPNDQALEEFVRLGELEHETDSEQAFLNTLGIYARNINNLVGDTTQTRVSGSNLVDCNAKLRQLENRGLLTDFVHQLNTATARRHVRGRHSSAISRLRFTRNCSDVTATMDAGTL